MLLPDNYRAQPEISIKREEVALECQTLNAMIYGTDGIALARENRSLVDTDTISHLIMWI